MDSTDQAVRDIGVVWDSHPSTHNFIRLVVRQSASWQEVSSKLKKFYDDSVDAVLSEVPASWIGHMVISSQVTRHPRDVFDGLARSYWSWFSKGGDE